MNYYSCCRGNTQTAEEKKLISSVIKKAYNDLGRIKFREVLALIHFILLALLWISRNPGGVGGWGSLFPKGWEKNISPADNNPILTQPILAALIEQCYTLTFFLVSLLFSQPTEKGKNKQFLLKWTSIQSRTWLHCCISERKISLGVVLTMLSINRKSWTFTS